MASLGGENMKLKIVALALLAMLHRAHGVMPSWSLMIDDEGSKEEFSVVSSNASKSLFERGSGFWTKQADEEREDFFGKLTDPKSQRENWYAVTPYIAEFWCAVSNIGFIYAGVQNNSPELIFAGTASIISHSIPRQWLLYVDKLGVVVALSKAVREHKTVMNNPWLMASVAAAGVINGADAYLARNKGYTTPHVFWHLSAAAISHGVLQSINK